MIRIAVVDDHPHVAIALRALLADTPDISLVAEAQQGSAVRELVQKNRPHVLFLDLMLEPTFDALAMVKSLYLDFPEIRICLLSAHIEPAYLHDLLAAGVNGYILKDDDYVSKIETIIRDLINNKIYLSSQAYEALAQATRQGSTHLLTEREREILRLAERGLPNPQIGQALHLSSGTVRNHLSSIYRKLGVRSRYEALALAKKDKLI